jgi:hypothetical protein
MSKKQRINNRKCSALLAAGTGAAVCLTGGSPAHAVNGMVSASNAGNSTFAVGSSVLDYANVFGSKASFPIYQFTTQALHKNLGPVLGHPSTFLTFRTTGTGSVATWSASVTIGSMLGSPDSVARALNGTTNKYIAAQFPDSGTKYGWIHVVGSTYLGGIQLDVWSYNNSGGTIKTLSESVSTSRLALTDGQEKLHWSNDNEDGVARYEVQSKDALGSWQAADSDVPGSGSYSAKVDSGKTCRLVVEMTDGTTKEIDF